jgi:glycosyltransferase involved in cell wall biosynthesis
VIRHGVIPASRGGKAKTMAQIAAIVAYLLPVPAGADPVRWSLMGLALVLTVVTGVDYLVRAIGHFVHDLGHTDTHFALLGFGDARDDLERLTHELELDQWVTFTGRADERMIRDYLSTADVGLSPDPSSPLNDVSTMNKTLEYMAFELPVVAFDLKESRVSAGEAAVYVDDNDEFAYAKAVHELLQDPARCELLGRLGRERVLRSFAWCYQEAELLRLYRDLLGHGPVVQLPRQTPAPIAVRPVSSGAHRH